MGPANFGRSSSPLIVPPHQPGAGLELDLALISGL
jgi:hypothetical protein